MTRPYMAREVRLRQLLAAVDDEPFSTSNELAERIGLIPSHTRKYLLALWQDGRIQMKADGATYVWFSVQVASTSAATRTTIAHRPQRVRLEQVRSIIAAKSPVGTQTIASELGMSTAHARRYLLQLQQAGTIRAVPSCVAERGRRGPRPLVWVSR